MKFLFIFFCLLVISIFFIGRGKLITLKPFKDLKGVKDYELEIMDIKRAETEDVGEEENYPKFFRGGKTGVLLIHGFTGAPFELLSLAEYLNKSGFSVYLARVAGHGSSPENLNLLNYEDWYESVKYGYFLLKNNCNKIIILGQSMGALVAVNTVVNNGADGLIMLAPCFKIKNKSSALVPYVKYFKKFDKKKIEGDEKKFFYDLYPLEGVHQLSNFARYTKQFAEDITVPTLMFQHKNDLVVSSEASEEFFNRINAQNKKAIFYEANASGYHALGGKRNPHKDAMFEDIKEWIHAVE